MQLYAFNHHIEKEIFKKLRASSKLRYSDLKDKGMESSLFMYHLKKLQSDQIVDKLPDGHYCLSPKGVALAQNFSKDQDAGTLGVLTYSLVWVRSVNGKWLIAKRSKHPHYGKLACISGKLHSGEPLLDSANRELSEATDGKIAGALRYSGYVSVIIENGASSTHITGPIWFLDDIEEVNIGDCSDSDLFWADWRELDYKEFIPGWGEIIEAIESGNTGLLDLRFRA